MPSFHAQSRACILAALAFLPVFASAAEIVNLGIMRGPAGPAGPAGAVGAQGGSGATGIGASPAGKAGANGGNGADGNVGALGTPGLIVGASVSYELRGGLFVGGNGGKGGNGGLGGDGGDGGEAYADSTGYQARGGRGGNGGDGGDGGNGGTGGWGLLVLSGGTVDVYGGLFQGGVGGSAGTGSDGGTGGNGNLGLGNGVPVAYAPNGDAGTTGVDGVDGDDAAADVYLVSGANLIVHGSDLSQTTDADDITVVSGTDEDGTPFAFRVIVEANATITLANEASAPDASLRLLFQNGQNAKVLSVDNTGVNAISDVFTQESGYTAKFVATGPDGLTRIAWERNDGAIALWTIAASGKTLTSYIYGPYSGARLIDLKVGPDDKLRMLWSTGDGGTTIVWTLPAEGDTFTFVSQPGRDGWSPVKLTIGFDGEVRVLSRNDNGTLEIRTFTQDGDLVGSFEFGPFGGVDARDLSIDSAGTMHLSLVSGQRLYLLRIASDGSYTYNGYQQDAGYTYEGMAVGADGRERVQWLSPTNKAVLWSVGPDGLFTYRDLGPFAGLTPTLFDAVP